MPVWKVEALIYTSADNREYVYDRAKRCLENFPLLKGLDVSEVDYER